MQDDIKTCGGEGPRREPPTSVSSRAVDQFLRRFLAPDTGWEQAVAQLRALFPSSAFVRDASASPGSELWSVDARTGFRVHLLVRHGVVRDVLSDALLEIQRELAGQALDQAGDASLVEEVDLGD